MTKSSAIAFACALALAGPALAQTTAPTQTPPSAEKPLDRGPNTPEANRAYGGGGVILQGAPGAPAPQPGALPPPGSPPPR